MAPAVWILSGIATLGLFVGGSIALVTSDAKPVPLTVSMMAYASIALLWMGGAFFCAQRRRIGRWFFAGAVTSAWIACVVGFGVAIHISQQYSGTSAPLTIWILGYLLPGVIPVTIAARLSYRS